MNTTTPVIISKDDMNCLNLKLVSHRNRGKAFFIKKLSIILYENKPYLYNNFTFKTNCNIHQNFK